VGSLRVVSTVAAAVILLGIIAARGSAQTRGTGAGRAGGGQKTTLSGIYTAAQAKTGEEVYFAFCVNCHPTPTYTGPGFKLHWQGKPLSELYDWVSEKMPKNDPGSLTPKESVQAIAYILQLNKLPTGSTELTTDRAALTKIVIQLK
jgi:Cytochrome C oxidase, cbb3-type, subunit III